MSEVADLTRRLVAVPSHDDETAAGDAVEDWLRAHTDADVRRDDAPNGGNVIARKGSGERTLALVGHHDVVPPADDQVAEDGEYVVYQQGGRIYGRGSADMKGADAAMLLAFRDADPDCELVFASFVGEETGGVGARHAVGLSPTSNQNAERSGDAIDEGFAPDHAVVAEGSTNYSVDGVSASDASGGSSRAQRSDGVTDVAVAHRGRRASTVVAHGEAAHAGEPGAGANAIYRACDAVDVLRDLSVPDVHVPAADESLAGKVTATTIHGGGAENVVPDRCEVTVDERTVPGERADVGAVEDVDGVEWRVDQDWPPMACEDEAFVDAVLSAARTVQADAPAEPHAVLKPHATDAGWLSEAGTECVVCGPAEPGEAHTDDESVSVAVLERCQDIYRGVAEAGPR